MTPTQNETETPFTSEKRTGHRLGPRQNEPRDKTVCCLVTDNERQTIDELSEKFGRTRSAYIVEWVVGLVEAVTAEGDDVEITQKKLTDFLAQSRQKMGMPAARVG